MVRRFPIYQSRSLNSHLVYSLSSMVDFLTFWQTFAQMGRQIMAPLELPVLSCKASRLETGCEASNFVCALQLKIQWFVIDVPILACHRLPIAETDFFLRFCLSGFGSGAFRFLEAAGSRNWVQITMVLVDYRKYSIVSLCGFKNPGYDCRVILQHWGSSQTMSRDFPSILFWGLPNKFPIVGSMYM